MKRILVLVFALSALTLKAQPQINVSGTGEVRVAPDEVIINAGVETRDQNLGQARHQNDDRMKAVLAFLKTSGIPSKDVQTDFVNITPDYDRNTSKSPPIFIVRKFIELRLTNVTSIETILAGMLDAGIDRINNVEFRTTELRKYRDQARSMAIKAAKEKADALCTELGVKRGKPLNINASESGGMWNSSSYFGRGYLGANSVQNVVQDSDGPSDAAGDTLSLGQVKVSATVNVSFSIE